MGPSPPEDQSLGLYRAFLNATYQEIKRRSSRYPVAFNWDLPFTGMAGCGKSIAKRKDCYILKYLGAD
jgi:hypothetical protein